MFSSGETHALPPPLRLALFVATAFLFGLAALPAQAPDKIAEQMQGAHKAYADRNYPAAVKLYRDFLAKYANRKESDAARLNLAICLLDVRDFAAAVEPLQQLAARKESKEHPYALYNLGLAQRGQGLKEPDPAAAQKRFAEAARHFAAAAAAFAPAPANHEHAALACCQLAEMQHAALACCQLAEMQLRLNQVKDARATVAPLLKDPGLAKGPCRNLVLYYHGLACFLSKDPLAAGRSLGLLTPFSDIGSGTHARYLLARIHHQADERAEAMVQYEGVLSVHDQQRKLAAELLKKPELAKNPAERQRLFDFLKEPPPEHVARALFHLGVLQYEAGRFGEAQGRFALYAKQYPKSSLTNEALLCLGYSQVQAKQFGDALKTLRLLADKEPYLADQAIFLLGKAQAGAADPNNPKAYPQALAAALEILKQAADRAGKSADPAAKHRRGEVLLELADVQQLAHQYREAASTLRQLVSEKLLPEREAELLQRQADALCLAGDFAESDKLCDRFLKAYPKSPLLPAILFRHAENAYFQAQAAAKNPNLPNRAKELARLNDEAARRNRLVLDKYPHFPQAGLARYSLALSQYRQGEWEKAKVSLEAIPAPDRTGELGRVPCFLADCLIRLMPARADDALAAGQLQEQLQQAIEQLDGYVNSQPKAPLAPDSLLKLGWCFQRQAALLAQPPEKAKALTSARVAYKRIYAEWPQNPVLPWAVFEESKCFVQLGTFDRAMTNLRRFDGEFKQAPPAPLAALNLATLLRAQNKGAEAANLLAQARQQHEKKLLADPAHKAWAVRLQLHHGICLREAGKLAEARAVLDGVLKQYADRPEAAEAALRSGQCLRDEALPVLMKARMRLAAAGKPDEQAAARKALAEALKPISDAAQFLEKQAEQARKKEPGSETAARMLYQAAWAYRLLAETETLLGGDPKAMPPSEPRARAAYQSLIAAYPDLPLSSDARLELAEQLAERGENAAAVKLLSEAIDKEPPPDLTERIRLRLGASRLALGDAKAAVAQWEPIAKNPKSRWSGLAKELLKVLQKEPAKFACSRRCGFPVCRRRCRRGAGPASGGRGRRWTA